MPFHFANVLLFSATAILFVFGSLLAGHFLRPNAPTREKSMIYECGEKPIGQAWFNFNPRFYLIALVFVIFEVEIAFMYPVASVYKWFIEHGPGPARVRRDLRVRRHPRRRPRLRLGDGRPRVGQGPQAGRAASRATASRLRPRSTAKKAA